MAKGSLNVTNCGAKYSKFLVQTKDARVDVGVYLYFVVRDLVLYKTSCPGRWRSAWSYTCQNQVWFNTCILNRNVTISYVGDVTMLSCRKSEMN